MEFKGRGSGDILMDDVECKDHHNYLAECDHNGWGTHDCTHEEDVGINCGKCEQFAHKPRRFVNKPGALLTGSIIELKFDILIQISFI